MTHLELHFQWGNCNFWLYMYVLIVIQHFKKLWVFKPPLDHQVAVSASMLKSLWVLGTLESFGLDKPTTKGDLCPQPVPPYLQSIHGHSHTVISSSIIWQCSHGTFLFFSFPVPDASFSFKAATQLSEVWLQWSEGRQILINSLLISALQNHSVRKK